MFKKFVASFMTALMAAMTLVSPAMGATALNTYPTFLGKVGDFYVVVGASAASSDVAGAVDIAANLAQLSYKDTTVSGTTSSGLTGTERKVVIPSDSDLGQVAGSGANNLPTKLKTFHYSGLKEGQYEYRGTKHNYHEEVELDDTDTALQLTHDTAAPINGTLKMRLENNATTYKFVFDDTIASADFSATSANTTTYANPLKVTVAGREFQVVAVPSATSFIALVGTVKTLSDGESITVGDLTFKVVQSFSSTTAKIEVTDASGNVVKSGINTGSTESVSFGGSTYNYRVLSSGATASGVAGYAQLLAGKGDIEKTFDGSDQATVTEFGSNWKISGSFANGAAGRITGGDFIKAVYEPASLTDATRFHLGGSTFTGLNNYFELRYDGYYPSKFAQLTIAPVTGVTVYNDTIATGYSTTTQGGASGLNGIKISTDVAGTITNGSSGYDEAYILFNASGTTAGFITPQTAGSASSMYWLAFKDKSTGRVVSADALTGNTAAQWPASITAGAIIQLGLSYGGPGAQKTYTLSMSFSNSTLFNTTAGFNITNSTTLTSQNTLVQMAFQNKSVSSTSTAPDLRLGATTASSVDANDVQARIGDSDGDRMVDVTAQAGALITDDGVQVYSVKSNVESDKVVLGIPPETVYGLMQFGKIGNTTVTPGGTVKEVVAVTTAVAKLDSEVSSTDKTGKDLVLVGGPCKNSLVADLKTAGKFAYGCSDWPARNFAVVEVVDSPFSVGGTNQAVVVAGTRAEDTRLASSVVQNYATKLSGVTASKVEVTGAALATATVTPA